MNMCYLLRNNTQNFACLSTGNPKIFELYSLVNWSSQDFLVIIYCNRGLFIERLTFLKALEKNSRERSVGPRHKVQ